MSASYPIRPAPSRIVPFFKTRSGVFILSLLRKTWGPGGARGPRAGSYLEALSSKLRTRAACAPRRFHRFSRVAHFDMNDSSENVGQDVILSHAFSSFLPRVSANS